MPGKVGFSGMILWWVRLFNDFEVNSKDAYVTCVMLISDEFPFVIGNR